MTVRAEDAYEQLRKIRMDLSDAQSKITDLFAMFTALNIHDVPGVKCERCGAEFRGDRTLSEHLYHSHDGPEPAHWVEPAVTTEADSPPTPSSSRCAAVTEAA